MKRSVSLGNATPLLGIASGPTSPFLFFDDSPRGQTSRPHLYKHMTYCIPRSLIVEYTPAVPDMEEGIGACR